MREHPLQYASTDKNKKSHYNTLASSGIAFATQTMELGRDADPSEHSIYIMRCQKPNIPDLVYTSREVTKVLNCITGAL